MHIVKKERCLRGGPPVLRVALGASRTTQFRTAMSSTSFGPTVYIAFVVSSIFVLKAVNEAVREPYMVRGCFREPVSKVDIYAQRTSRSMSRRRRRTADRNIAIGIQRSPHLQDCKLGACVSH